MPTIVEIDAPGEGLVELEFPDDMSEDAMRTAIYRNFPALNPEKRRSVAAVNDEPAPTPSTSMAVPMPSTKEGGPRLPPSGADQTTKMLEADNLSKRFRMAMELTQDPLKQQRLRDDFNKQLKGLGIDPISFQPDVVQAAITPTVQFEGNPEAIKQAFPGKTGEVLAGINKAASTAASAFTSPLGVLTLGQGALPQATQRAVSGAFAADMGRHIPGQVADTVAAIKRGDTEAATEQGAGVLLNSVFTAGAGKHAVAPSTPMSRAASSLDSIIKKAELPEGEIRFADSPRIIEKEIISEVIKQAEPIAPRSSSALQHLVESTAKPELKSVSSNESSATTASDLVRRESGGALPRIDEAMAEPGAPRDSAISPEQTRGVAPRPPEGTAAAGDSGPVPGKLDADIASPEVRQSIEHGLKLAGIPEAKLADAVGSTLEKILRLESEGKGFDPKKAKLVTWVSRIARNHGIDLLREDAAQKRAGGTEKVSLDEATPDAETLQSRIASEQPGPDYVTRILEAADTIEEATRTFGQNEQRVVRMLKLGESVAQVAKETGLPVSEVNRLKSEVSAKLRDALRERGVERTDDLIGAIKQGRLQPSPVAAQPLTVKPLSQIIRDLSEGLGVPIRFGRLVSNKFAGYFLPTQKLIASKFANDIKTVAHEAGHHLDEQFKLRDNALLSAELLHLGDNKRNGSMSSWTASKTQSYRKGEGVAEFLRYYLTEPATARSLAPNLSSHFDRILSTNPDIKAVLENAQRDVELWRSAPNQARLRSSISVGENPSKVPYSFDQLTRDVVDDLHVLRLAVDDATKLNSAELRPSQNPYILARLLRGSYGMADTFIAGGIVDFRTREVKLGTSFKHALEPVRGNIDNFRDWIVARQAKEMHGQGKFTGLDDGDIAVTLERNTSPTFEKAFENLRNWSDGFVQYAVDSGLISKESGGKMREMNREYVPMHRVFEVGAGEFGQQSGSGRGLNAVANPLKGRKGSMRDIVDPLETYMKNAYAIVTAAEKNAVNIALADLSRMKGMGKWVERVAAPKERVKVSMEKLREELVESGADLTGVPDDLLITFFRESNQAPFGQNVVKVNRGGELEFYRLDGELYKAVQALGVEQASTLLKLLAAPAQLLRAGATTTVDFAVSNAIRDTVGSAIISRYGTLPFESTVRGLFGLFRNEKLVREWAASGGRNAIETTYFDRDKLQAFLREKITKDMSALEQSEIVLKSPLTALRWLSGTLEEATRIGEYQKTLNTLKKRGMNEGDARRQAAFEARDLQDFAKRGAKMKNMSMMVAFMNSTIQGNVRLVESFKTRPAQTILKGLAFVTIPKMLEQLVVQDDEDYWDLPQWQRDLFFNIPYRKDEHGRTRFLKIPVPFTQGVIFGTLPGRILQWVRENDASAFDGFVKTLASQVSPPVMPNAAVTMMENFAGPQGYDFFKDRNIVPVYLKDAPPELQFTEQTSLTARRVGSLLGVSPMKVDHTIQGFSGGLGKQITHQGLDRIISAITDEERTAKGTGPGSRFLSAPPGVQSQSVDDFFKALEEQRRLKKGFDMGQSNAYDSGLYKLLSRYEDRIGKLRKASREAKTDKEKYEITLQIRDLAREALKIKKEDFE